MSGIVYVIRNGLQWKDAPKGCGPHKLLYNRFIRWSRLVKAETVAAALNMVTELGLREVTDRGRFRA